MKESRTQDFKLKVFTKSDILNLAQIVMDESQSNDPDSSTSIEYTIRCADNTRYQSQSIDLFKDGEVLDKKKALSVQMQYLDYRKHKKIDISITQGYAGYSNYFTVEGEDSNWAPGVFTRLGESIAAVKPQDVWILRHKTLAFHIIALGLGMTLTRVFTVIFDILIPKGFTLEVNSGNFFFGFILFLMDVMRAAPWTQLIILPFLIWLTGIWYAYDIRRLLLNLWEEIEFDFGPEHLKIQKSRRNRLAAAISLLVVPTIVTALYDFAKGLLAR